VEAALPEVEAALPRMEPPAASLDLDRRVKLAANPATAAAVLVDLAADGAVTVRAAVALNPSVPKLAQRYLATDVDERVRLLIARKLANALPGLSGPAHVELREQTLAILSNLVRDEAVRIRAAIATCLAGIAGIPRTLILALAHDTAVAVSEPVLRLSPLLSAKDLLILLAAPPHDQTASAIAGRANLPEAVADAIAISADSPAIRVLLANGSAAIREGTLNALIARATEEPGWHVPLVRRPRLPDHAARALAEIVARNLLTDLAARADLSPAVIAEIRQRLAVEARPPAPEPGRETDVGLLDEARQLESAGTLDEARLLAALRAGQDRRVSAMLAIAAAVPLAVVDRAASLRSVKGLVSLVWKAGFSMRTAGPVQATLGQIRPDAIMLPTQSGDFPLRHEEMGWQLDFLDGRRH
jgi:uncharacterized protein (DUF2336 family)